jgi:2-keto-4-pentenoate hydratase/2-oxohepta-3-ene-1,7-dioic acid hydratase in catechol pathway
VLSAFEAQSQIRAAGPDAMKGDAVIAALPAWRSRLETADEIPDPDDVALSISVNGELKQSSSTRQLIYDCRKLIEWGSSFYTFYPGDVLYTGTPEGVSPVKPGDTMLARIDRIGEMRIGVRAPGG